MEQLALGLYKRKIIWVRAMQQLFGYYQKIGNTDQATKVVVILADALPYLENLQYAAGQMLIRQGREPEARRYLTRAAEIAPP